MSNLLIVVLIIWCMDKKDEGYEVLSGLHDKSRKKDKN